MFSAVWPAVCLALIGIAPPAPVGTDLPGCPERFSTNEGSPEPSWTDREVCPHGDPPRVDAAPLDAILADALKVWQAPGMAVAVVRDGEVIYLKGVGVRAVGKPERVTPDTLFGIGSLTKAFTATALGILVDEGKIDWDDTVRKHIPWFRLADPLADRDVTLRDLLCHRTGLSGHTFLWYHAPWSPEESVRRLAFVQPSHSFRSHYEYANIPYLAAGLALSSAAEKPWPDFMRQRLFEPLGMKSVVFTRTQALAAADHATPHLPGAKGPEATDWYDDDKQLRASGSIKTNVRDLSQWLRCQLGEPTTEGKRVVSAKILAELHKAQVVTPLDPLRARLGGSTQAAYGLGWHRIDHQGKLLLEHGGAVDGFRSTILLMPKERLGIVVLTNVATAEATTATALTLLDHLLGLPPQDWQGAYRERVQSAREAEKARAEAFQKTRQLGTKTSHDLAEYAGVYEEPAYGKVTVTAGEAGLRLSWSSFKEPIKHFHFDTFTFAGTGALKDEVVQFEAAPEGTVGVLRMLGRKFERK
jgi:CubicO group peptidase (beta-lactamase class C family)